MIKIYFGGCVGRYYEPDHVNSMMRLVRRPEVVRYAPRFNDAAVDRARSQCATQFLLDSDADVLLQVDSDIVFQADDAIRICQAAMERDIVGGVYVTRGSGRHCFPTSLIANDRRVAYGNDSSPVAARYLAGGFVAAHRRVFERLCLDFPLLNSDEENMRFYPFYIPMWAPGETGTMQYLSEDWAFCHRAKAAGFGVWIDPSVRLLHLGLHPYRLEDMLTEEVPTQWMALTRHQGGSYKREALEDPRAVPA